MTGARKYALIHLLGIPIGDDPEDDRVEVKDPYDFHIDLTYRQTRERMKINREKCARGDRLAAQAERFVASAEAAPRALPELWSALSEPSTAAWRWVPCPIELRHALDADDDQALQRFVDVVSPRCSAARGRQLLVSIARDQLQRRAADPGAPADPAPSN